MRITINPVLDMESLEFVGNDGVYEYDGPVLLAKGGGMARANYNTANDLSSAYSGQGLGINASLVPTLESEISNPLGFGEKALAEMKTEGGQAAAGAQSAAQERARLAAGRTGNTAALPGIQDKLARTATQAADQNALGLDVANAKAKLAQQQQGIRGLQGIGAEDTGAGLNALGLSNQALNSYMKAANWWESPLNSIIGGFGNVAAAGKL